jgi:type IV pilus assembly protein PilA
VILNTRTAPPDFDLRQGSRRGGYGILRPLPPDERRFFSEMARPFRFQCFRWELHNASFRPPDHRYRQVPGLHLVRARVVEGLGSAAAAKALVSENAMHGAPFNSGWQAPSATDNVNAVSIEASTGNVTIAYTQRAGDGSIVLVPTSTGADGKPQTLSVGKTPEGQIVWTCYAQGRDGAPTGATLAAKLAPPECRGAQAEAAKS